MHLRRFLAVAFCGAIVFLGGAFVLGNGTSSAGGVTHTCSAPDRQFLQTVRMNMTQLGFWSDQLSSGETPPGVVIKQAFSEADQIAVTHPTDPTLFRARGMLRVMFAEYGRAIRAKTHGGDAAGRHMGLSWRLAYHAHDLLAASQQDLDRLGCDLQPVFATS